MDIIIKNHLSQPCSLPRTMPRDNKSKSRLWKPPTAMYCCTVDDQAVFSSTLRQPSRRSGLVRGSKNTSFSDLSHSPSSILHINGGGSSDLLEFQLCELRAVTHNFSRSFLLGKGGFGRVHKGYVDESLRQGLKAQAVAVKLLDIEGPQGHREWLAEVILLGQLRHPNLVKLIGYCCEGEDRLLVYEFMPRGSLENHLFRRISTALAWSTRVAIAAGAARGLAFLHGSEDPVIYRDFKTSNILLDSDFSAKLSDFGLAKMGPKGSNTHVTTRVMGTYGYAAPEYVNTGHLTTKSDIYSFGVVLLELLTGRRAIDKWWPESEQNLVEWSRQCLTSSRRLRSIMDPRLAGQYPVNGAKEMALLALRCVSLNPRDRPRMPVVVETLDELQHGKDRGILSMHSDICHPSSG